MGSLTGNVNVEYFPTCRILYIDPVIINYLDMVLHLLANVVVKAFVVFFTITRGVHIEIRLPFYEEMYFC